MGRIRSVAVVAAIAGFVAAAVVAGPTATADSGKGPGGHDTKRVRVLDDCDPASFNAVLGDGACVGDGDTTFDELVGQLIANGTAKGWAFKPKKLTLDADQGIHAVNRGGEFHTFTEVAAFGGGCVDELNALLGLTPVPECADPSLFGTTGIAPGQSLTVAPLDHGVHHFECLIHPWMRSTVTVRAEDHSGHEHH